MHTDKSESTKAFTPAESDVNSGMKKIAFTYGALEGLLREYTPGFEWRGGPNGLYTLSPAILADIATRIERDKERFRHFHGSSNPSPEKVAGIFVYWIAKRRPIVYMDGSQRYGRLTLTQDEFFLNEYLAILAGIMRVISSRMEINHRKDLTDAVSMPSLKILLNWRYTLAYRNFSSDDMALLFESCL